MKKTLLLAFVAPGLSLALAASSSAQVPPVGDFDLLGTGTIEGSALSYDGNVCFGAWADSSGNIRGFRWTQSGGLQDLGALSGGTPTSVQFKGADATGALAVGYQLNTGTNPFRQSMFWSSATGLIDISSVFGTDGYASGISATDGFVSGTTNAGRAQLFHIGSSTLLTLPLLTGGTIGIALNVSPSGRYTVGSGNSSAFLSGEAFRYDLTLNTITGLGVLPSPGSTPSSTALDCSAAGVTVGYSSALVAGSQRNRAVVFGTTLTDLGVLTGYLDSYATAISGDGRYVVGYCDNLTLQQPRRAFIYDRNNPSNGMMDLTVYLGGLVPSGWYLESAMDVDQYGSAICGTARGPSSSEAFVAR